MRALALLALLASPLTAGQAILPIASGEYDGSNHTTTVAMENRGPSVAVCRLYSPNLDLTIKEEIGPEKTVTLNHLLYEVTLRGVLRVDCSDSVDVVARIQETPGGGQFLFDGRLFRPFSVHEPLRAPARRLVDATADLALTEIGGKPLVVEAIGWNGTQRGDSKVYKIAPYTFRMVDLPDRFQMGTGRVEIDVISGEGTLVIGRETRDSRLHHVARPALQRPQPLAIPAPAPANIVRLMHVSPFKAAPFQDPATGLIYMRDRWYDPKTGTFLTPDRAGNRDSSNLYAYCGGDPVNCTDPTGMYGQDMHFYAVHYLARAVGFTFNQSNQIAWASQYVDAHNDTQPDLATSVRRPRHLHTFHFVGPEDQAVVRKNRIVMQNAAFATGHGLIAVGVALHSVADSFSHEGFQGRVSRSNLRSGVVPPLGHADAAEGGHFPDKPYTDVAKALDAAKTIYDVLTQAALRNGVLRPPKPWTDVAARIRPLLASAPGRQLPPWYLTGKMEAAAWQVLDKEESAARVAMWQRLLKIDYGRDVNYDRVLFSQWIPDFERAVSTQDTFIRSLR